MSTQENMAAVVAANDGEELYRRIANSQGNIVLSETGSGNRSSSSSGSGGGFSGTAVSGSSNRVTVSSSSSNRTTVSSTRSTSKVTSRSDDEDEDKTETSGPGYTAKDYIEDSQISGPTVQDVTVSENYFEDFGVYEEALNNTQFFYATVGNGGITDEGVMIELPAGMSYEMEKDGVEIAWSSGQTVTDRGSYVLKLTAVEDDSVPFSEQKIYKAVFRFRIQERVAQTEADEGLSGMVSGFGYGSGSYADFFLGQENGVAPEAESTEAETAAEETAAPEQTETAAETEETLDDVIQAALGEGYGTESLEGYCEGTGLSTVYDEESGIYRHELASGEAFFTDVPNGTLTNGSVILTTNDALPFVVLKDGEQLEYEPGTVIEEPGSYLVFPRSDTSVYRAAYSGKNEPLFHFRIVDGFVNDLGLITAPQNSTIRSVTRDGAELSDAEGREWYLLSEDGHYAVEFDTPSGGSRVVFDRDTAAPRFYYHVDGQKASISYVSDDVTSSRLLQDGKEVFNGNPVSEISDTGSYEFLAYDDAGNSSSADITISYHMNTAAILAILLVIALVVLLVVFIRRTKKQMKVV